MWFLAGVLLVSREVLSAAERDNRAAFSRQTFLYDWVEGRCSLQSNAHSCRCMEKIAVFDPSSIVWWGPTTLYWISHKICFFFFLVSCFLSFSDFCFSTILKASPSHRWAAIWHDVQPISKEWAEAEEHHLKQQRGLQPSTCNALHKHSFLQTVFTFSHSRITNTLRFYVKDQHNRLQCKIFHK